ncbi:MAG: type II toxin-antitoxin system VapC family toxin [Actinomycetota bacterium]|nr:type II toxin-antitoxin system VapC family toxin [Actinomycetota bacterium]
MIVVDTSAVIAALAARPPSEALTVRLRNDGDLHAPHLLDVEFLHALRRLVATRKLTEDRAAEARGDFADMALVRYPHHPLADRMWERRRNLTAYDAAFIALAEALGVPLITCDGRLARAGGHQARVELFRVP